VKRFWVFGGDVYYPSGGIEDLKLKTDELAQALNAAKRFEGNHSWAHVYDTYLAEVVFEC